MMSAVLSNTPSKSSFSVMVVAPDEEPSSLVLIPDVTIDKGAKVGLLNSMGCYVVVYPAGLRSSLSTTEKVPYLLWEMLSKAAPVNVTLDQLQGSTKLFVS